MSSISGDLMKEISNESCDRNHGSKLWKMTWVMLLIGFAAGMTIAANSKQTFPKNTTTEEQTKMKVKRNFAWAGLGAIVFPVAGLVGAVFAGYCKRSKNPIAI